VHVDWHLLQRSPPLIRPFCVHLPSPIAGHGRSSPPPSLRCLTKGCIIRFLSTGTYDAFMIHFYLPIEVILLSEVVHLAFPWLCSLMTSVNVTTVCIHSTALGMMRLQPKSGILQTPRVCVGAPLWSGGSSGASARLSQLRSRQWLVRLIIGTKTCTGHAPGVGSCPSMIQLRTALRTALDGSSIPHGHTFSLP
jgi:hypothetical protein